MAKNVPSTPIYTQLIHRLIHNPCPDTHFLMKTLSRVASEMALHVLAYNLTRLMKIMGIQPLIAAIRA